MAKMQAAAAIREKVIEQDALIDLVAILVLLQMCRFGFDSMQSWSKARNSGRGRIDKIVNTDMPGQPSREVLVKSARVRQQETVPARAAYCKYMLGEVLFGGASFLFRAKF
jgi:hypothetical protein